MSSADLPPHGRQSAGRHAFARAGTDSLATSQEAAAESAASERVCEAVVEAILAGVLANPGREASRPGSGFYAGEAFVTTVPDTTRPYSYSSKFPGRPPSR